MRGAALALLACGALACGAPAAVPEPPSPAATSTNPPAATHPSFQPPPCAATEALPLAEGNRFERQLAEGVAHCYRVDLPAGAYLHLEAGGQAASFDLVWTVTAPEGEPLPPFDLVSDGSEPLHWLQPPAPRRPNPLLLRLHELHARPGSYTLTAAITPRPSAAQRAIAQATLDFAAASAQHSPTLEGMRPAIERAASAGAPRTEAALLFRYADLVRSSGIPEPARDDEIARIAPRLIELQDDHGGPHRRMRARMWAGQALAGRDELPRAERWLRETLALASEGGDIDPIDLEMEGNAHALFSELYRLRGEPGQAERELQRSEGAFRASGRLEAAAQVLLNLADSQTQYGDGDLVRSALARAEALLASLPAEAGERRWKLDCQVLEKRGDLARHEQRWDTAERYYQQALDLAEAHDLPVERAAAIDGLGRTAMMRDDPAERARAVELLRRSWQAWTELPDAQQARNLHLQLAHALFRAGDARAAAAIFDQYCPPERLDPVREDPLTFAICRMGQGRLASYRGELATAVAQMVRALDLFEVYRDGADRVDQRGRIAAYRQYYYEEPIDLALRLHFQQYAPSASASASGSGRSAQAHSRDPEPNDNRDAGYDRLAFALSEQSRARWLRDSLLLRRQQQTGASAFPAAALDAANAGDASAADTSARLAATAALGAASQRFEQALFDSDQQRARALAAQRNAIADYLFSRQRLDLAAAGGADALPFLDLDAVQQRVAESGALLLQYDLGPDRGYLWAIGADGVEVLTMPSRRAITGPLESYRTAIAESHRPRPVADLRQALQEASLLLLAPVAHRLDGRPLWIVANGQLDGFPFAALPLPEWAPAAPPGALIDTGGPVAQMPPLALSHQILRPPSVSAIGWLTEWAASRGEPAGGQAIALIADPVYDQDPRCPPAADPHESHFRRLVDSAAEARAIAALAQPGTALVRTAGEADRSLVLSERLAGFRRLHFATHAVAAAGRSPELASLVLSRCDAQGRSEDSFLYAYEIADLHLRAKLATLSGCDTGLGHFLPGEGFLGLPHAFFQAGVPRTLVSLWQVSDASAPLFMEQFYRALLQQGATPTEALQSAQRALHDHPDFHAPYHWAGYTLRGIP